MTYQNQSGRSMVEMLGVLAVAGVLTVVGVSGFRIMMDKHRANTVITESRMAYIEASSRQSVEELGAWRSVSFTPSYGISMQVMRDQDSNDFVKLERVPRAICTQILSMGGASFGLYGTSYEQLTSCGETTDMVVSWNKKGAPVECKTDADCSSTGGVCVDGHCITCEENQYWDAELGSCHDKCVAHTDCPSDGGEGYCGADGRCGLCKGGQYDTSAEQCVCNNGHAGEFFINGECRCSNNFFRKTNGDCVSCTNTSNQPSSEEECASCPSRSYSNGQCSYVQFKGGSNGNSNYSCDNYSKVESTQAECAKCDVTNSPREYWTENGTGYCFVKCKDDQYRTSSGQCVTCSANVRNKPYANDPAECNKCGKMNAEGYCMPICPEGSFLRSFGTCMSCSDVAAIVPMSEAECAKCAGTESPRQMQNGYCVPVGCPEGTFKNSKDGSCVRCIDESQSNDQYKFPVAHATAAECAKCDTTANPREVRNGWCMPICSQGTFLAVHTYQMGPVTDTTQGGAYGQCISCSDDQYAYASFASECAACNNTEYPRGMIPQGYCMPKEAAEAEIAAQESHTCASGYFEGEGRCQSCSNMLPYIPYGEDETERAAQCARCNGTSYPREMLNGSCVRSNCGNNYFRTQQGECKSCGIAGGMASDASECAKCDGTSYPREMLNGYCVLKTCPTNYFKTRTGDCQKCSASEGIASVDASECAKCDSTSYPREMMNGYCARKTCGFGYFKTSTGGCVSCNSNDNTPHIPLNEAECASCPSSVHRQMVDGYCIVARCIDERFMDIDGICRLCSDETAYIPYDAAECAKCAAVGYARTIASDGACVRSS